MTSPTSKKEYLSPRAELSLVEQAWNVRGESIKKLREEPRLLTRLCYTLAREKTFFDKELFAPYERGDQEKKVLLRAASAAYQRGDVTSTLDTLFPSLAPNGQGVARLIPPLSKERLAAYDAARQAVVMNVSDYYHGLAYKIATFVAVDVEELHQEALYQAFKLFDNFSPLIVREGRKAHPERAQQRFLGYTTRAVKRRLWRVVAAERFTTSLNQPPPYNTSEPLDRLQGAGVDHEERLTHEGVARALLVTLSPLERLIVMARHGIEGEQEAFSEIAARLGKRREYVRAQYERACRRLRGALKARGVTHDELFKNQ